MCGRYTISQFDGQLVASQFGAREAVLPAAALGRFNVCPTEPVPAVVAGEDGSRELRVLRWGLVPPWARELAAGYEPINARSETAGEKRPFAELCATAAGRCLVLADGWYEWLRPERPRGARIPFRYTVDDGGLFAFAGLWHERRVGGERVASVAILTTVANPICAPVHDRMPCVLADPEAQAAWLSPELDAAGALEVALPPLDARRTAVAPANPAVNRAGIEGAHLIEPPPAAPSAAAAAPAGDQLELGL
jgi:putative SOS response-associated peptidase YedK